MTKKEESLYRVVDIVIDNCSTTKPNGQKTITRADVFSRDRRENIVEVRAIVSMILTHHGYSTTTIAELLGRTPETVRNLLRLGYKYLDTSKAFKMIYKECADICHEISL